MKKTLFIIFALLMLFNTMSAELQEINLKICINGVITPNIPVKVDRWDGCGWITVEANDYTSSNAKGNYQIDYAGNAPTQNYFVGLLTTNSTYRLTISNNWYFLLFTSEPEGAGSCDSRFVINNGEIDIDSCSISPNAGNLSFTKCTANPLYGIVSGWITGPTELMPKERATYTIHTTCGSGNYTYQWSYKENYLGTWTTLGTGVTQQIGMNHADLTMKCVVTDVMTGQTASPTLVVYYGLYKAAQGGANESSTDASIPSSYDLNGYPNPFNPTATIGYQLPSAGYVTLKVHDALGREVAILVNGVKGAGTYSVTFNAEKLSSGIYIVRMVAQTEEGKPFVMVRKMMLMK